ncbi:MAG: molybdenum cofactor guanylyltransferase [Magnetococcus sp. YQC-9]
MEGVMGVVLAGGLSRRMGGQDKSLLLFAGQPLLKHALARFAPQVNGIMISANGDPSRFDGYGLTVIRDARPNHLGPMAGIEAAFLATDASWLMSVPVDLPFLPHDLVARLCQVLENGRPVPVMATSRGRVHPVVCLWPREALPALSAALDAGERRLLDWFANHPHKQVDFTPGTHEPDPFFNLNDPVAKDLAEQWISSPTGGVAA